MIKKRTAEKEIARIKKELNSIYQWQEECEELSRMRKSMEIPIIWDDEGELTKDYTAIEHRLYMLEKKREKKIGKILDEDYEYFQIGIGELLELLQKRLMKVGAIGDEANQSLIMRKTKQEKLERSKSPQPIYKETFAYGLLNLENNKSFMLPQVTVYTSNPKISAQDFFTSESGYMNVLANRILIDKNNYLSDEKSQDEIMKMVEKNIHKVCEKPLTEIFNDDFFLN